MPRPRAAIQLRNDATLGSFLTDEAGNTLYYFTLDVTGSNNCGTPECASEWPTFYAATPTVGPGLNQAGFTTGKTASGRNQTFYKGVAVVLRCHPHQRAIHTGGCWPNAERGVE